MWNAKPAVLRALWVTSLAGALAACGGGSDTNGGGSHAGGGGTNTGGGGSHTGGGGTDTGGTDTGGEGSNTGGSNTGGSTTGGSNTGGGGSHTGGGGTGTGGSNTGGSDPGIPCAAQEPVCPEGLTCCDAYCVDVHADPQNCGACGNACTGAEMCTGLSCVDLIVANVCQNPSAAVSLDQLVVDDTTGMLVGDTLEAYCDPAVTVRHVNQTSDELLDQATNRPITGPGDTLVAGGGAFNQKGLAYLDAHGHSPLYVVAEGANLVLVRRAGPTTLVNTPVASLTDHHDYFAFYVATEPTSGTLALAVFGLWSKGTTAAGWYWQHVVAPDLPAYDKGFYVYEWTDGDGDAAPGEADTFTPIASGPAQP